MQHLTHALHMPSRPAAASSSLALASDLPDILSSQCPSMFTTVVSSSRHARALNYTFATVVSSSRHTRALNYTFATVVSSSRHARALNYTFATVVSSSRHTRALNAA